MDLDWIWKAILIVIGGTFLLRFAGRKSISQMTLAQTVIMIGIGSLLVQPVAGKSIWTTLGVGATLVLTLVIIELAQIKSDKIEKLITGKSKVLIEGGVINIKNMRKLRITVDQLEMKLRQQNVSSLKDIEWATLEPNGQIGYMLKEDVQPVTKQDFRQFQKEMQQMLYQMNPSLINNQQQNQQPSSAIQENIFSEVQTRTHKNPPPKYLQ